MKRIAILIVMVSMVVMIGAPVWAQDDDSPAVQAVNFLLTVQNDDGGFTTGWAPESDIAMTADVVVAAVAAGLDPEAFFVGEMMNPLSYLGVQIQEGNVSDAGAGTLAKVLNAAVVTGKDVDIFGGTDLVADLLALQSDEGVFGFGAFDHCLSMLALQNAGVELPDGTVDALVAVQNEDGGWGFLAGEPSDTNTSGLCLQALALADAPEAIEAGLAYLTAIQNEDSGWPYQNPSDFGTDSDVNSTALVVQALIANEQDLVEWNNPQEWLSAMQNESGAFGYQVALPDDNILATVGAIPAIEGMALNAWAPAPEAE